MGCSYLKHLNIGKNAHYTSERIMQELLDVLASAISSDNCRSIHSADYFSVLCDETTDIAVWNQLKKEVRVSFISTCRSDGAAVMIGKYKGVAKLLKDKTDGIMLNCHCINHKLDLVSSQAAAE
ncbi:hypothetical protein PR048_015272, partial [Dryococelus australis]